jgi:hypothetical protein
MKTIGKVVDPHCREGHLHCCASRRR